VHAGRRPAPVLHLVCADAAPNLGRVGGRQQARRDSCARGRAGPRPTATRR
jgi:hypothetical protein